MRVSRALILGFGLLLAACSGDDGIRQLSSNGEGPDEFRILPAKPLSVPKDFNALPTPTPGGANSTDVDPVGDAVVALGGSRKAANSTSIPGGDAGLVNYSGRLGRAENIRATVAADDAEFRKKRGRFTNIRIVKEDRYNEVYKKQHLNQYAEQDRWRRGGATTPAAPPNN
ncbi:Beta-barrel assembly machine subunit BamF [Shimia gijangensis]|uniref:Beta-barrel assembly machine subunit BamF n=1 Tax=Shimia gijangensis TaxID=1470563 RepID=A0A1M6B7X2_9RHOB|nr:DUF3035 domain-containing protein [Shimia gijangensis]SHI44678.1 Beta-barrel assembly machine subunit BamF [Shimia gijangensis]